MKTDTLILKDTLKAQGFYNHVEAVAPQIAAEARAELTGRFPKAAVSLRKYCSWDDVESLSFDVKLLSDRFQKISALLEGFGKGKTISATLSGVTVTGLLDKRVGKVFADAGTPNKVPFNTMTGVRVTRGTGYTQILPIVFTGNAEMPERFTGEMEIDELLLKKGGPFRLTLQDKQVRLEDLSAQVTTFRLALTLVHQNRRARREIMLRLRSGAVATFSHTDGCRGETKVELPAGKARKAALTIYTKRSHTYRWLGERALASEEAAKAAGVAAAEAWLANPALKVLAANRRYNKALLDWKASAENLVGRWNEVCFKEQKLSRVPVVLPIFIRPKASSGKRDTQNYHSAKSRAETAWTELREATEQMKGLNLAAESLTAPPPLIAKTSQYSLFGAEEPNVRRELEAA